MTLLTTRQDLRWLAEVHAPIAAAGYRIVILYGNEDSPSEVHLFARDHYRCKPTILHYSKKIHGLVVVQWGEKPRRKT